MMRSSVGVRGFIQILEWDARTGRLLSRWDGSNSLTNAGLDLICERLRGNTGVGGISHYAIGTDSTPPVPGNTALVAEAYRAVVTQTRVSGGSLIITLHLGSTQGNGAGSVTYQEGGAFSPENVMLCRGIYPPKTKTSLKELSIIHTIPLVIL